MKKFVILVTLLCVLAPFAFAGEANADQGDLLVNVGVNFGYYGFGVGAGVEYIFAKWDIPNFAPLTFGGAGRGAMFFYNGVEADLAALVTMHFGLKAFTGLPEFLRNFDWYWGLGLGLGFGVWGGFGMSSGSGICYYINPSIAISLDYFYNNYFSSGHWGHAGMLGVRFEL